MVGQFVGGQSSLMGASTSLADVATGLLVLAFGGRIYGSGASTSLADVVNP